MLGIAIGIGIPFGGIIGGTGAGVNDLLLETGDHFLLQSGVSDVLIFE